MATSSAAAHRLFAVLMAASMLLSACGDDDDGDHGVRGGGSGGTSSAGEGGSSAAGKGGNASGDSSIGGAEAGGGSSGDGSGLGGAGNGGASGAAGQGGTTAGGGAGGQGGGQAGSDGGGAQAGGGAGGTPSTVEYRACEMATALSRIFVHRIDESAGTCTRVVLLQASSCTFGISAGGWCLEQASVSTDLTACKALTVPSNSKGLTSATGTLAVSGSTVDIDVMLQFPPGNGLPTSVSVRANDCSADCMLNDCRP